jgi:1-acyl-sn-glycerol-3-phosphate acyltransferase
MLDIVLYGLPAAAVFLLAGAWICRRLTAWGEADWGSRWLNCLDGLNRLFCRHYHRLRTEPLPLPETGPALVVANHVSGLDPLLLIAASKRPLRFIIASEQYHRFGLHWLFKAVGCIPVDRKGRPERAFRAALRALEQGEVVALFPHGKIHLDSHPPRPLKPGFVRMAQLADCPIYPVRIEGVRGEGLVATSALLRSRARLTGHPPVFCHDHPEGDCLDSVAARLNPGS